MLRVIALLGLVFVMTGCLYRMPCEDELVIKPLTNNPSMTGDKGNALMPGASF